MPPTEASDRLQEKQLTEAQDKDFKIIIKNMFKKYSKDMKHTLMNIVKTQAIE